MQMTLTAGKLHVTLKIDTRVILALIMLMSQ